MSKILNRTTRKYIYGILLAAFPVAVLYFPELAPAAPLWLALGLAILNLSPDEVEAPVTNDEYGA